MLRDAKCTVLTLYEVISTSYSWKHTFVKTRLTSTPIPSNIPPVYNSQNPCPEIPVLKRTGSTLRGKSFYGEGHPRVYGARLLEMFSPDRLSYRDGQFPARSKSEELEGMLREVVAARKVRLISGPECPH